MTHNVEIDAVVRHTCILPGDPWCQPCQALCACGCPWFVHIGEIGCACALPGEPPCVIPPVVGDAR